MRPNNCPVCHAPDGFHDEAPHSAAREAIPAELKRPSNSALRREARAAYIEQNTVDGIRPHLPRTPEEDALELYVAQQQQRFYEGAEGRRLLADMAAALLTPDAPQLDTPGSRDPEEAELAVDPLAGLYDPEQMAKAVDPVAQIGRMSANLPPWPEDR